MNLLQPMMVVALLVTGMGVALLGSLKVPLARRLAIDEGRVGGLVSLFGFVLIPVILAAGFWTDQAGHEAGSQGKELVLLAGSVMFAVSLGILAAARTYGMALAAVILLSASWAVMVSTFNEWMESTQIEPSPEYGDYYLEITKLNADTFRAPAS